VDERAAEGCGMNGNTAMTAMTTASAGMVRFRKWTDEERRELLRELGIEEHRPERPGTDGIEMPPPGDDESGIPSREYVYGLELEDGCFYCGLTNPPARRMLDHFERQFLGRWGQTASRWTRAHRPKRVLEIRADGSRLAERRLTIKYMMRHGWRRVRGSAWCRAPADREPTLTPGDRQYARELLASGGGFAWIPAGCTTTASRSGSGSSGSASRPSG